MEKKKARGLKLSARVLNSPKTPRVRKQTTPHSKRRKLEAPPTSPVDSNPGGGDPLNPPMLFNPKAKSKKVSVVI